MPKAYDPMREKKYSFMTDIMVYGEYGVSCVVTGNSKEELLASLERVIANYEDGLYDRLNEEQ